MGDTLSSVIPASPPPPLPVFYNTPEEATQAYGTTPPAPTPQPAPAPAPAPAPTVAALPTFYDTPEQAAQAYSPQPAQPAQPVQADQPVQPVQPEQPVVQPDQSVQPAQSDQPAPPEEGGFFSGLISGAGAATTEGARLAQGDAFTTDPNAQPEPQRGWFNELGYGIGHSFPVLGAGLGGGFAGGAVGGPVGAVAGAALGVGGMSFVQDLVPTYDAAVRGGMSHDEAVDYAIKHAAASGVINAATAPLFELAPFRSVIGKILFQSLVTQPVAGGAARVGVPAVLGEPLPSGEEMVKGFGQDVASGVAFGVGHQVGARVYGAVRGRPGEVPPAGEEAPPAETPPVAPPPDMTPPPPSPPGVPTEEAPPVALPPDMTPPPPSPEGAPAREPPPPAAPPDMTPPPSSPEGVLAREPPLPAAEMTPPPPAPIAAPDDRLGTTTGRPGPEAPVGEVGAPGVQPAGEQARLGGQGDQVPGAGDNQGIQPVTGEPSPITQGEAPALADRGLVPGPEPTPAEQTPGTSGPAAETPQTQLDRLVRSRDELAAKPNPTPEDTQRVIDLTRQVKALARRQGVPVPVQASETRALQDQAITERRAGRVQPFTGPPEVGKKPDFLDYKYNDGTSVYRSVFEQAGHNPDLAVNKPIEWQNKVLTQHMQTKFGFRDVNLAPDATAVDAKITRDAMLDMTRAVQDMMASLGQPHEAASLNGRLGLVFDPEGKRPYYGSYRPGSGEITITGGANSFGHEWTHAVDHFLAERLTGNPVQRNDLLTKYARAGLLDPKDGVQGAFAKVLNTIFYDKSAQALREIDLANKANQTDRQGNPTKAAMEARRQIDLLERAGSNLRITPSEFRQETGAYTAGKQRAYYLDPVEMLARAHEAYLARQMQNSGADPRGAVMPDEAYINQTDRTLKMLYPKAEDRMNIFKAFDDLHNELRKQDVLSEGKPPGAFPNLGVSDPKHYPATVPPGQQNSVIANSVRTQTNRWANLTKTLLSAHIFDPSRPSPGELTFSRRMADIGRSLTFSHHGIMETIIARAPKAAKPHLQSILDRLAAGPGEGRYTGATLEEADRTRSRDWTRRFANILKAGGYQDARNISAEDDAMIRHVLVTGEDRYPPDPNKPGITQPIPANIQRIAGNMRGLMDEMWRATHDAGMDVGYAKNGYYPRLYDQFKIFADANGFRAQASKLHALMFDQELGTPGSDPNALLEKWTTLSKADRQAASDPDLPAKMAELNKNLRRQREIEQELATPFSQADPVALRAELQGLKSDAQQLAVDAHPLLRDHLSTMAANDWYARIAEPSLHTFDTTGPSGKYLNARVLPPEADIIMRDYMRTSIADAIPNYIHAVSRRVADSERFGTKGEDLKRLSDAALQAGTRPEDLDWFMHSVNAVRGVDNPRYPRALVKMANYAHAAGSVALMPRAMWSALAEPMNAALATGSARVGFKTFANQFGQLMRTASSKERTEAAELMSVVTSAMHDSIMLSRMSADYSDDPALNKFMTNYYRLTGLTQLTNSQRAASAAANHWFLSKLARDLQDQGTSGGTVRARDNATRWFNELGIPDAAKADFAKWLTDDLQGDRPTSQQLLTDPMAGAYGLAIRRLTDRSIQDPYKVDRAAMAGVPIVGLAFQLMSFNYQFARNVLNPAWERVQHSYGQAKAEALAGGAGRLGATAKGLAMGGGAAAHAGAMAGTMVGVGLITTALRQYLFAPDQWQKHEEDGDLGGYLLDLAMQRSGLNGTLDPLIQLATNARYSSDFSSLIEGASVNWLTKNLQDIITPLITANDSPNSNTRYFNAARGAFNLIGVPAAAFGLNMLGTLGAPARALAGAALQYGTSPGSAAAVAGAVAGPKGAKPEGAQEGLAKLSGLDSLQSLQSLAELGKEGEPAGEGPAGDFGGGMIPWGLADDVAIPAWRTLGPMLTALPGPVKAGALGLGALYGGASYLEKTAPFRGQPAPEPKQAKQVP